jgi:hypothetical protein
MQAITNVRPHTAAHLPVEERTPDARFCRRAGDAVYPHGVHSAQSGWFQHPSPEARILVQRAAVAC